MTANIKLKLQVVVDDAVAFGPGKADLLDAIGACGSISAAARAMGMSYRRAWQLVATCNRCFARPLVATVPGGGATLTDEGIALLAAYRRLAARVTPPADDPDHRRILAALRT